MWRRWAQYRRVQRAKLAQIRGGYLGDREDLVSEDAQLEHDLLTSVLPQGDDAPAATAAGSRAGAGSATPGAHDAPGEDATSHPGPPGRHDQTRSEPRGRRRRDFGAAGRPINRQSPFYVGFVGAIGVLTAYAVVQTIGKLNTTITLLIVAFFLTLVLNPLVEGLTHRRMHRGWAVTIVFLGALGVFSLIGWLVIPPVVQQATELVENAPTMLGGLLDNAWIKDLDQRYEIIPRMQEEITRRAADGKLWAGVFGGVLGAGKIIATGIFSVITVLVLTLYFLASLPSVKQATYALVPASRRPRIISLSEEIMRRVGSYAIGQVTVATINATCAWIVMTLLDIPFAAVLAVVVGLLGLIPMVGATLGAAVVVAVAFVDEPKKALIIAIYFTVYQQLENYAVMPRVMQRTVAVPGAVTIVAALAGGTLLGILGALLAIPVAAGLLLIYEEVLVPRQRHQ
ncbi:MAG: AI-2E family transporter [Micrococcales bacterium]|nr:AI-2E family transporter [Micrococcales bacterium]